MLSVKAAYLGGLDGKQRMGLAQGPANWAKGWDGGLMALCLEQVKVQSWQGLSPWGTC